MHPDKADELLKAKLRKYKKLYVQWMKLFKEGCTCDIGAPHGCPCCNQSPNLEKQMQELLGTK